MRRWLLVAPLLVCTPAHARDGFDAITCGNDIVAALRNKKLSFGTTPAVEIEARHRAIALKHLGSDGERGDPYGLSFWQICGDEYVMLEDLQHAKKRDLVLDILKLPALTKTQQRVLPGSRCTVGAKLEREVLATVEGTARGTALPVTAAWRIDVAAMKLVPVAPAGMICTVE